MVLFAAVFLVSAQLIPASVFAWGITYAPPVKVVTQNLYLGADIFKALEADPDDPLGLPKKVREIYLEIVNTDFNERAGAIADQIEATMPDLVGLQEVSIISTQSPSDFFSNPQQQPNADTVEYEFLQLLLDELASRSLEYEIAAVVFNADVEFPMLVGFGSLNDSPYPLFDDARLTDRDVILVREGIPFGNVLEKNYTNMITYSVGGFDVNFVRGYCALDATVDGTTYRFVNTHLEVEGSSIDPQVPYVQAFQAFELISILQNQAQPIILVGDINSSPTDITPLPLPVAPYFILRPYWQFSFAGYADVWPRRLLGRSDPGYTCCQEADLLNEFSTLSERIDMIFVRNDLGYPPFSFTGPVFAWTLGADPADKTETGLWPSDHAGVFSWMRIPIRY
ncbi:MAG: endonuclease/exonuclease/phosphatase family protein [Desulfomonilia bacterium]|nr:endonuclease/exonuclease/phosphatase family protein [Desulfomonilia bacterium]